MRDKRITVAAINITVHPHPTPRIYADLLKDAYKLKRPVQIRGEACAILRSVSEMDPGKANSWVSGEIAKYLNIDLEQPWFDLVEFEEADEEESKKIRIPEHLKPNFTQIEYILVPEKHMLFFVVYHGGNKLAPALALKYFRSLFSSDKIIAKYGQVETTIVPEREVVNSILKSKTLQEISMIVTRPNSDDLGGEDEILLNELDSMQSREMRISHKSQPGKSIKPNEKLKQLAKIAAKNGVLSARVKNEIGVTIPVSTEEHPEQRTVKYNPKRETFLEAMKRAIASILF